MGHTDHICEALRSILKLRLRTFLGTVLKCCSPSALTDADTRPSHTTLSICKLGLHSNHFGEKIDSTFNPPHLRSLSLFLTAHAGISFPDLAFPVFTLMALSVPSSQTQTPHLPTSAKTSLRPLHISHFCDEQFSFLTAPSLNTSQSSLTPY